LIIAIDGPTASGKSRLGKNLSDKLKIDFVDSGKLYRIIAYLYKNSNSNLNKFLKSKNWDEEFKRDDFSNDDYILQKFLILVQKFQQIKR